MGLASALSLLLLALPLGLAHPAGEVPPLHAARPRERSLSNCEAAFSEPEFVRRSIERRMGEVERLRKARGLNPKHKWVGRSDYRDVLNKNHQVKANYNENTSADVLFGSSGSCMLDPEVTEGPLYVLGEQVRRDITEGEGGVPMTIDIQVVDVSNCKPMQDVAVDFWSCNSTGVYGGVLNYPGNGDPNDLSLINVTTLRGIQFTDAEGIATFDTVVPGHYAGRANHVHALAHVGAKRLPNNTITGGNIAHVGQMYFDQSLLQNVEKTTPYSTNHQSWMQNSQDFLFQSGSVNDDPVVYYVMLGNTIQDGIFAWIRFGVTPTAHRSVNPAAWVDEHGGHQGSGGGGFFPPPGGGGGWPWGK